MYILSTYTYYVLIRAACLSRTATDTLIGANLWEFFLALYIVYLSSKKIAPGTHASLEKSVNGAVV